MDDNIKDNSNEKIQDVIQQGIHEAKNIKGQISGTGTNDTEETAAPTEQAPSTSVSDCIDKTATILQNINTINDQVARLNLNPTERAYLENSITPMLAILNLLSTTSYNLATSVSSLATSPIVCGKRHELKDTIDLVYDINSQCEDVFELLEKRIDFLLKIAKC